MKCEQIEPLLKEYRAGTLPSFKRAWAFQHLAGCPGCRAEFERQGQPAPAEVGGEQDKPNAEAWTAASAPAFRKRRSQAVKWLVRLCVLTLLGAGGVVGWQFYHDGGAWLSGPVSQAVMARLEGQGFDALWNGLSDPMAKDWAAMIPERHAPSLEQVFVAAPQSKLGVNLRIEGVDRLGEEFRLKARFEGRNLLPPGNQHGWVQVYDSKNLPLQSTVDSVLVDRAGITVFVLFPARDHLDSVRLQFDHIGQEVIYPWRLELPDPPERFQETYVGISGFPSGLHLERYGIANHLLGATVSGPFLEGLEASPRLYLQDAAGYRIAPQEQQFLLDHDGKSSLLLQYPVPRAWQTPLWLVGDGVVRKNLGSWTIDVTMIK